MVDATNNIPIYLPDDTLGGRAVISADRKTLTMTFVEGMIPKLVMENLIGFSVVYLSNEARDQVAAEAENIKEGENR